MDDDNAALIYRYPNSGRGTLSVERLNYDLQGMLKQIGVM